MSEIKGHVLVVEDNEINGELLKEILERYSYTSDYAENGKIALSLLEKNKYDMVFMDLQMPILDGYETTAEIRKNKNAIPIIALTANIMEPDKKRCFEVGMNDYISKPFEFQEIEKVLNKYRLSNA